MKLSFKHRAAVTLMNLISKTWRIKVEGEMPSGNGIVIFWHGKMLPAWKILAGNNPYAVVSQSKDGEILSELLKRWGFELMRGSSSKDGKKILEKLIFTATSNLVLMTPDGPRGPREVMKAGAVIAAQRANAPLFLCGILIKSKKIFKKSWDLFEFPLPFTKIIVKYSKPFYIAKYEERYLTESKISDIQNALREINVF